MNVSIHFMQTIAVPHAVFVINDRSEVSDHSDVKKTRLDAEKASTRSISSILTLSLIEDSIYCHEGRIIIEKY